MVNMCNDAKIPDILHDNKKASRLSSRGSPLSLSAGPAKVTDLAGKAGHLNQDLGGFIDLEE